MGSMDLQTIRNNVRSELNETTTTGISDAELNIIINDGYKDVAVKGLCSEIKVAKDNMPAEKILSMVPTNPVRINYAEYKTGTTEGGKGTLCCLPSVNGYAPLSGSSPQYWFPWGQNLVWEPVLDVATYDAAVYTACYPAAVRSSDTDCLDSLPAEFHECVYLFALSFAALKLKRWADAANAYNQYVVNLQLKRGEYISGRPDLRAVHTIPDVVQTEEKRG